MLLEDIGILPADVAVLEEGQNALERIGIRNMRITEGTGYITVGLTLVFEDELAVSLPGLNGVTLVFGGTGNTSEFKIEADLGEDWAVRIIDISFALRFSSDILRPARATESGFEADPSGGHVEIGVSSTVIIDHNGFQIEGMNELSLAPCMIADSGFIIEASKIALDLSRNTSIAPAKAAGLPDSWMGVFIEEAAVHLPSDLPNSMARR